MNWLPLRTNNIPLIDRQVDKAIILHKELKSSIYYADIQNVEKLSELQLSMKKRIREIDEFYNKNCLDERVRFLHGSRLKLSRATMECLVGQREQVMQLPWKVNKKTSPPQPLQSRNQPTSSSGKTRTLTESNNNKNSMKKLNDLIFTIKLTKQQYEDFMEIKKNLNLGTM